MQALKIVVLILFAWAAVRTFSFGVYGLRRGRGGTFAISMALILTGLALLWQYIEI